MDGGPTPEKKRIDSYLRRLYLTFLSLAVISLLGLDYINLRKGDSSFFFSALRPPPKTTTRPKPLEEMARSLLTKHNVPESAIESGEGDSGIRQIVVRVPLDSYAAFASELERDLLNLGTDVSKEEKKGETEITYSWRVRKKGRGELSLLFRCAYPEPPEKEVSSVPQPAQSKVAIIIDDMGFSLEALDLLVGLNIPLTVAILPLSPYARETATVAHQKGLEVMLHLPCESLNHQEENDGSPSCIRSDMGEEEIRTMTEDFLARVPFIKGVNNHMGSKITQEPSAMRPILEVIAERQLYFVDSRTTGNSIAFDLSKRMGIRSAFRHVFLDTSVDVNFSKQKLIELLKLARKMGTAVGIGHPFPETFLALKESLPLFHEFEVEPVFASQAVR